MTLKIIAAIIIIILIIYISYLIIILNKMIELDKQVSVMWMEFIDLLNKRKTQILKYIKDNKIKTKKIVDSVNNFNTDENPKDLINSYYKLNEILTEDMLEDVKINTNIIAKFRLEYNDKALKLNNYIDFLPSALTARVFKFNKRVYFRDK